MTLPSIQTSAGAYSLLEFDNSPMLAIATGLDLNLEDNVKILQKINQQIANYLASECSALVCDPVYTFPLKAKLPALILRLEQLIPDLDPLVMPQLIPNWGVENVRQNYALAKIELFYHPAEKEALTKKQLLAEIYDYCQYEHIALFLKLIVYTPADETFDEVKFQEAQLEALTELRKLTDLVALQFPYDALAAATLTAELDIPWVMIFEGKDYDSMKNNLRTALENGAQGFLATMDLYKEITNLRQKDMTADLTAIDQFLKTTGQDRIKELTRITDEMVKKVNE